jgi:Zn-dependent alcohol dehydrogenase
LLLGGERRLRKNGQELNHFFLQSSFAEYAVVPQETAIKVRQDAPLETVGILGCGVMTGVGSVVNTAQVEVGTSATVFGCGGVGLSAVMAARLAGMDKVIAVDILDTKLRMAEELGATNSINAARENVVEHIKKLSTDGTDYSFVAVGNVDVVAQAVDAIRPGGKCIVIGAPPEGTKVSLDVIPLLVENKSIIGCCMGSAKPTLDIPRFIDLYMEGRLPIDRLVTRRYPLDEINQAFQALDSGEVIKPVIAF